MDINHFYRELPTLRTPRLILRKLRMDDVEDAFAVASGLRVTKYLRWGLHHPWTIPAPT
jgi:ribosomal-protein-alanine N-acetyltransferase